MGGCSLARPRVDPPIAACPQSWGGGAGAAMGYLGGERSRVHYRPTSPPATTGRTCPHVPPCGKCTECGGGVWRGTPLRCSRRVPISLPLGRVYLAHTVNSTPFKGRRCRHRPRFSGGHVVFPAPVYNSQRGSQLYLFFCSSSWRRRRHPSRTWYLHPSPYIPHR